MSERLPCSGARVLHIGKFFLPDQGGMEVYLADLVREQRQQGIDARALVHGTPRADDPPWLIRVPVRWIVVFAPLAPGFRRRWARLLRNFVPDVLHLHLPNTSAFWALSLFAAFDVPWVVHWHSDVVASHLQGWLAFLYRFYRPFEQAMLEQAAAIIVTSPPYLEASAPLQDWRDKCFIVPLGLDAARVARPSVQPMQLPWSPGNMRILSVGRLTYYKGFETLIAAVAATPGVELVIVGEGGERAHLEACIATAHLHDEAARSHLLGGISDDEKYALFAQCDLFALASRERTEAFGVAVLEAMYFARPCLVSDLKGSGLPWLVRSSGAGECAPVDDVAMWSHQLARLRDDAALRTQYGAAGARSLRERFDIAASARGVRAVYRAVDVDAEPMLHSSPLIVIPAHNEEATIGGVVARLHADGWRDILVVDDLSTDDTATVARESGAHVLRGELPMGAWGGMQTGIRYAVRHGYAQVVTLDADGQHEPACVPRLLEAAREADFVIGSAPERGSWARRVAWRYFRWLTGFQVRDLTSGFRCYNRAACEVLAGEEATLLDYQDLGVLLILHNAGMKAAEVPVTMYPRASGSSRIFGGWRKVVRYMLESSLLCLARWQPRQSSRR